MKASDLMGPFNDWLKFATMSKLAEQVVDTGTCPKCHKKTLAEKHNDSEIRWLQCSACLCVYGMPARRLIG